MVLEARDALLRILVPALSLEHFIAHGRTIAQRLAVHRPQRPMQVGQLLKIFRG